MVKLQQPLRVGEGTVDFGNLSSGEKLSGFGSVFFSFGANRSRFHNETRSVDWTDLRDRWDYSHVARAALAFVCLIALVIAVSDGS